MHTNASEYWLPRSGTTPPNTAMATTLMHASSSTASSARARFHRSRPPNAHSSSSGATSRSPPMSPSHQVSQIRPKSPAQREARKHEAAHTHGRADGGAHHAGQQCEAQRVESALERSTPVREAAQQVRAEHRLERIAGGDAERGRHRARGGEIDGKRAEKDARPRADAERQQCAEREPRSRPHGGGARMNERQPQAELADHEIGDRERDPPGPRPPDRRSDLIGQRPAWGRMASAPGAAVAARMHSRLLGEA